MDESPSRATRSPRDASAAADATMKKGSSPSSNTRKRRQKRPVEVEPRTPSKRSKVQRSPFQSPIELGAAPKSRSQDKELLFKKSKFLAVRNESGGFYLCQTNQHVHRNTRSFKVRWLSLSQPPDVYKLDFYDTTELECVITTVRMDHVSRETYKLPEREKLRTEFILQKALNVENGIQVDLTETFEEAMKKQESQDSNGIVASTSSKSQSPPPTPAVTPTRPRRTKKGGKKKKAVATTKATPTTKVTTPVTKTTKDNKKKPVKGKTPSPLKATPATAKTPKDPNINLTPRPRIKVLEKDPFYESRENVPVVSSFISSKLLFRALKLRDNKILTKFIEDLDHVALINPQYSIQEKVTPLQIAIRMENHKAIELLWKASYDDDRKRVKLPTNILSTPSTGRYDPRSLGVPRVRTLTVGRGSKEGNAALTKDNMMDIDLEESQILVDAITHDISKDTLDVALAQSSDGENIYMEDILTNNIVNVIRTGNRKLAAALVADAIKAGHGFNFLHIEVLKNDDEPLSPAKSPSVKKKPYNNDGITPIHCACINPNASYLTTLMSILPEYNIMDKKHWRPIHYAATCEGPGPMELLLQRGVSADEIETQGNTPLMIACKYGRAHNVEALLKKAKADVAARQKGNSPELDDRFGIGGVHKMDRSGRCAIHMAAENGHLDVVRTLLKHGADANKAASAARHKMNCLQIAAARGDLAMVQYLVQSGGAIVEFKDRFKRTALTHAVMNNHTNVASYLVHIGANPNHADSSGNTCIHYAVAYGSYFGLKVLLDADGDPNATNDWKLNPHGVAFMKGNTGLLEMLLSRPGVDINFRDDDGMTLLMLAAGSPLEDDLLEQVEYLIKEQKADNTLLDVSDNNVLHHLAINHVGYGLNEKVLKAKEVSLKMAEIFIENGTSATQINNAGKTPTMLALYTGNAGLVKLLIEKGGSVSTTTDEDGWNVLHHMAHQSTSADMMQLLEILMQVDGKEAGSFTSLKDMSKVVDNSGYTPLLRACEEYCQFSPDSELSEEETKQGLDCAREFIKGLIDLMGADVNSVVGEKKFNDEPVPLKEKERYVDNGKMSAVHFMLQQNESEGELYGEKRPGLEMILRYHPQLDTYAIQTGHTPLIDAILLGNSTEALLLIEHGASVNMSSIDEEEDGKSSPLIFAVRNNLPDVVKALVAKGANVNARDCRDQLTALHEAVGDVSDIESSLSMIKCLLENGATIDAVNNKSQTPLHLAILYNDGGSDTPTDIVEYLIEQGADLSKKDKEGRLPLHFVFIQDAEDDNTAHMDPIELCGAVTMNMKPGDIDSQDLIGSTPLHRAALHGAMVCCMHLLQRKADINRKDKNGNTPVGLAVLAGHKSCAVALIQKDANINVDVIHAKDSTDPPKEVIVSQKQIDSPSKESRLKKTDEKILVWKPLKQTDISNVSTLSLFQAIVKRDWQGVTYILLDQLKHMGISLIFCVESALRVHKYHLAMRLMKKVKDDKELTGSSINSDRQNLLHVLAYTSTSLDRELQLKVAEILCNRGINVSLKDKHGCSPLTYAVLKHNEELVEFIINKSTESVITEEDNYGRTPLAVAFWDLKQHSEQTRTKPRRQAIKPQEKHEATDEEKTAVNICKKLIMKGANVDILCDYPFVSMDVFDSVDQCAFSRDYHQKTGCVRVSPLVSAIRWRRFALVKLLLDLGASINFADETKMTPVMHAVRQNDIDILKLLLDHSYSMTGRFMMRRASSASFRVRRFMLKKAESILAGKVNDLKSEPVAAAAAAAAATEEQEEIDDDDIDLNFEPFTKKSKVDLNVQDKQGWTVIHHLVCPLDDGTYDNVELLKLLVENGAVMNTKDRNGLTPLDYALIKGASNLAKGLQKLAGIKKDKWDKPSVEPLGVTEIMPPNGRVYNYQADAEAMLQQLETNSMETNETVTICPDPMSGMQKNGEVVTDDEQNIPFDTVLVKVDVQQHFGLYVFYKMQVIHQLGKDMYILMTRWGKIGDPVGQYQQTPFPAKEPAIKEFHKVFKEKTGNDWNNVKSFTNHPKKYRLIAREDQVPGQKVSKVKLSLQSDVKSTLPDHIQEIFKELTNINMLSKALESFDIDEDYMPFGKIKKEALLKAREILEHIKPLQEKIAHHHRQETQKLTREECHQIYEEIAKLSNDYYHLVPTNNYEYTTVRPLTNDSLIRDQVRKITNLLELEQAGKMLLAAQYRQKEMNPLDYIYQCMGCTIQLMSEDDPKSQYILKYIHSSMPASNVEAIYKVSRQGESERLQKCGRNNRHLLWHGSSSANLLSILTRGLLIAPPQVGSTGAMFGKGIYLADTFKKSSYYCRNYNEESDTQFMLLCEGALGKIKEFKQPLDDESEIPKGNFDSIKGVGRQEPNPSFDVTIKPGIVMPMGKLIEQENNDCYHILAYNEYIVYDEAQVCLRYIVQFKK
ncbi:poly [ADP-ribose] polymerase tankyrase-like [Tubulanus polymorphus]|uniref:poly [ADP-ribose] polymerase tankyrase-like n=1 Tax=Tubulanus polymorphus TaxID=672921 RepID=UPI003DA43B0D